MKRFITFGRAGLRRSKGAIVVAGALFAAITLGWGSTVEAQDDMEQLRQLVAQQRQSLEALEKRLGELETKEEERSDWEVEIGHAKTHEIKERGFDADDIYDNGFYIRSEDNSFALVVNGFAQARYTLMEPEEEGKSNHNFDVALARIAFSGTVFDPKIAYFFQFETTTFDNNNRATMLDWWMQYRFSPDLSLLAGRFILPYSRQFYTHPGQLLFPDLSEADYAFNLQRTVGAHLAGKLGRLSYHAVAANSIRALDAGGQQNIGDEITTLGRLEFDILDPYGYLESSPTPASAPQLSVGVAASFNPIEEVSRFQNVQPGDRTTNVTLDAGFRWDRFTLQGAGYYRRNNLKTSGLSDSHDWGYYGQLAYYLVPERWELAARISGVDFDQPNNPSAFSDAKSFLRGVGDIMEYTFGLNYYLYGHGAKVQIDYSFLDTEPFVGANYSNHRLRVQTQVLF